jgi:hypothetical protein
MGETARLSAVHTCPVWQGDDGPVIGMDSFEEYGFEEEPELIAWCNVAVVEIKGTVHELLLNREPVE